MCKFETKPVTVVLHRRVALLVSAGSLHSWVSPHADSKDPLEREEGGERESTLNNEPYNEREKREERERKREGRRRETGRYLVVW